MRTHTLVASLLALSFPLLSGCPSKDGGGSKGITVSGQLRNAYGGVYAGASVLVGGEVVTTDSSGSFTVTHVDTPYDLFFYDADLDTITGFIGATRPDPIVVVGGVNDRSGSFDVTLSPASVVGDVSRVGMSGAVGYSAGSDPDAFTMTAYWSGAPSLLAHAFVSRVVVSTAGLVTDVHDFGDADVTFQASQSSALPINMAAMATTPLAATAAPAAGYEVFALSASTVLPDTLDTVLFLGQSTTSPVTFRSFSSALYSTRVTAAAYPTGGNISDGYGVAFNTLAMGTTAVTLEPPERLTLTTPAALSTFGAGGVMTWTSSLSPTAGFRVEGFPVDFGGTLMQIYVANTTTFTMPDLSPLGVSLPSESYYLSVIGFDPGSSTDEVLDGRLFPDQGVATGTQATTERRAVTAGP